MKRLLAALAAAIMLVQPAAADGTAFDISGTGPNKRLCILEAPGGACIPFAAVDSIGHVVTALPSLLSGLGLFQIGTVNWTVCAVGCTYTSPLDAWNAARGSIGFGPFAAVNIKVSDGFYSFSSPFYTDQPGTEAVHILGNTQTPAKVMFDFPNIVGNNGDGFIAERGGRIGTSAVPGIDGVTINGTGARISRSTWADQSYGAGAFALGSGSNIYFGSHVVVQNFYYSVLADQGGRFVGDGSTYRNAGDSNLLSRFSSVIQCLSCTLATASHVFADAYGASETLGHNALAEGSASMYVDGSNATDAQIACFSSHTAAAVWAHAVTATGCLSYGASAQQNGMIELGHAHLHGNGTGAYADTGGRLNVDGAELDGNTYDGLLLSGGYATGSALNSHNNGGYGVDVKKNGRAELYATTALLRNNNPSSPSFQFFVEQQSGCKGAGSLCTTASTYIGN